MSDESLDRALVSTVLIPAPPEVAAFTESWRAQFAGADFFHVPPHLTVMWPFVSPGTVADGADPAILDATAAKLRDVCRDAAPFSLTLDRYAVFPRGGVLYLAPRDPAPIMALQDRIFAAFPQYVPYEGQHDTFIPHMTLGFFSSEEALAAAPKPAFEPFTWWVDAVHWLYGDLAELTRWQTAAVISLGQGEKG